ncbi:hypothetical protein LQW54_002011 [Pestalotiopsis sp. IQ-011]
MVAVAQEADTPASRSIGHLSHYSSYEISCEEPGYLKDWALIKLDANKFPNGFPNKVFLGNAVDFRNTDGSLSNADGPELGPLDANGFLALTLESRLPESEKAFWVGKQGATSGLTLGVRSGIEAVVRRYSSGREFVSWEAPVVSKPGERRGFTDDGDSGSCVFDLKGRIVGIVVGRAMGNTVERKMKARPGQKVSPEEAQETMGDVLPRWSLGTDITFSSPIEWVLSDVETFTGSKPRLS